MVAVYGGISGNGQWVRTRNPEGAKAFMQEKAMEAGRREASAARSQDRRDAVLDWLRARWQRVSRR